MHIWAKQKKQAAMEEHQIWNLMLGSSSVMVYLMRRQPTRQTEQQNNLIFYVDMERE